MGWLRMRAIGTFGPRGSGEKATIRLRLNGAGCPTAEGKSSARPLKIGVGWRSSGHLGEALGVIAGGCLGFWLPVAYPCQFCLGFSTPTIGLVDGGMTRAQNGKSQPLGRLAVLAVLGEYQLQPARDVVGFAFLGGKVALASRPKPLGQGRSGWICSVVSA